MASQETAVAQVPVLYFVVRHVQKKADNSTWIGATIFHPLSLRRNKVLAVFSRNIIKVLTASSGKIKPGSLIQIKNQQCTVQFIANNKTIYNLDLREQDIPTQLDLVHMADPFNFNESKSTSHIKHKQELQPSEFVQKDIMNKYLDFNDHINYYQNDQKHKQKSCSNRKRKFDEIDDSMHDLYEPPPKQRKLMHHQSQIIALESKQKENDEIAKQTPKKNDKEQQNEMKDDVPSSIGSNTSESDKEEAMELRRNHLYVPSDILSNQDQLIRFDGDNMTRMVYDSEEDRQQKDSDNDNQESIGNTEDNPFAIGRTLLQAMDKLQHDANSKWSTSKCGMYWISSDVLN
eukprot:69233_1